MKISIIIPVLNSHEVLRRQLLYMNRFIQDDTEIIIVDDGSDPPLEGQAKIIRTNDKRPWTWALARNRGAREAQGEYLLMFDIDHIITPHLVDRVRKFGGYKMGFTREFGVLTENGELTQDLDVLYSYGLPKERVKARGLKINALPNNFAMRKDVYWEIGGYREDLVGRQYPQGEDRLFKKAWCEWTRKTGKLGSMEREIIYMFPNGYLLGDVDADPMNLFHKLTRKTRRNHRYVLA